MRFEEAKLTSKGQITIPKSIRTTLGLKPGEKVIFIPEEDEVIMIRESINLAKDFEKIRKEVKRKGKLFTKTEIRKMIKESKREWSKFE